jgi:hypothetical protein
VQTETDKEDRTRYIEELAGESDYWLSITDAARVCRVQDVSIRRAIARGALPVRRQRAGQNKRTRFVRAGDLPGAGFPIIDESAVITTEVGKADILSIPRQQQRILQDHQVLLAQLAELQDALAGSQALLLSDLAEIRTTLGAQQEAYTRQLAATETRLLIQQEHLQTLDKRQEQESTQTSQSLTQLHEKIGEQREHLQVEIQELRTRFTTHQQDLQRLLVDLEARQQQRLLAHQHTVQERFQQVEQRVHEEVAQHREHMQAEIQELRTRFTTYQQDLQRLLADLEARQQQQLLAYQHTVQERFQQVEHEVQALLHSLEQRVNDTLELQSHAYTQRLTGLAEQLAQQQEQLQRQARLLPLLPYAEQRLLTEQDERAWEQALAALEGRLSAGQHQHIAQYQPLLTLLSPARVQALEHMLDEWQRQASPQPPPPSSC